MPASFFFTADCCLGPQTGLVIGFMVRGLGIEFMVRGLQFTVTVEI